MRRVVRSRLSLRFEHSDKKKKLFINSVECLVRARNEVTVDGKDYLVLLSLRRSGGSFAALCHGDASVLLELDPDLTQLLLEDEVTAIREMAKAAFG
jgi:hypothetical protein